MEENQTSAAEATPVVPADNGPRADIDEDSSENEAEVGVIGKLETPGVLCKCKGTKSAKIYRVKKSETTKVQLMCKEQVIKLGFYKDWKLAWAILEVLDQRSDKEAKQQEDELCLCEDEECNKLQVYEVRGWYNDKIVNDWMTEFHLTDNGPGFRAHKKWVKEGMQRARKLFRS